MLVSRKRGPRQPLSFKLGGDVLEQVQTFKYLGQIWVSFSSSLSWSSHVELSCLHQGKKAAWSGLQKILRFGGMIEIYKTLICPHLEYAAPVWAPILQETLPTWRRFRGLV